MFITPDAGTILIIETLDDSYPRPHWYSRTKCVVVGDCAEGILVSYDIDGEQGTTDLKDFIHEWTPGLELTQIIALDAADWASFCESFPMWAANSAEPLVNGCGCE